MTSETPGPVMLALAEVFPTEWAARDSLARAYGPAAVGEYHGIWRIPWIQGACHLFTDLDPSGWGEYGWELISSALPGDPPWRVVAADPACDRQDLPEDPEAICAECRQRAYDHPGWRRT